uniref:Ribonuclease n=1 Tax=Oncorhynchus mykiss TaxID=8022 RepID=A0A8K9WWX3_ONCMY
MFLSRRQKGSSEGLKSGRLEDIDRGPERGSIPQAGRGQELCRLGSSDSLTQHYLYQHAAEVFKHILYYTHTHTEKETQRANNRTHTQMILTVLLFHRSKYNLNALSHDAAIGLVQFALDSGVQLKEVFVDTVGPAEKYQEKLSQRFPGVEVTVRPKADSLFPIVSAASICAKVARDHSVKDWNFPEDLGEVDADYGSGYPNDPKTKAWLLKELDPVFGYPQFVRFSWSTTQTLLDSRAVTVHWDDDEEDGEKAAARQNNTSMLSYFKTGSKTSAQQGNTHQTHRFFTERRLQSLATL